MFTLFLLLILGHCFHAHENLVLLTKKRSAFLQSYRSYADIAVSQVDVPPKTVFVSFKISAEPFDLSIFGCTPTTVNVYAKKGSIPLLNPDNSVNPKWAKNITHSELHALNLLTDRKFSYINITSPESGLYYFVAFFPYVDPDVVAIKQKGLSQSCTAFINILAYVPKTTQLRLLTNNHSYQIQPRHGKNYYYQFLTQPDVKEVVLRMKNIEESNATNVTLRLSCESMPSKNKYIETKTINLSHDEEIEIPYWLNKGGQYFLEFDFDKNQEFEPLLEFSLNTVTKDAALKRNNLTSLSFRTFDSDLYKTAVIDYYKDEFSKETEPYKFYELIKESGSESFLYTFNIQHEEETEFMVPVPLNLTHEDFSVLKFKLEDIIDVGGTFEFSIMFRPPSSEKQEQIKFSTDSASQIIIGCISQNAYEIPELPRHCVYNGVRTIAPIVINNTADNATVLIPFPEAGTWYATLKLFCNPCQNCLCYQKCSEMLQTCIKECDCHTKSTCRRCSKTCKAKIEKEAECGNCNCDDNCEASQESCNSTIMFDLSSFPCVMGCGPNGRCQFMVADGYIYSACSCRNQYRGLDCRDGSKAAPFWKVVLAQVLLITSNAVMLPCAYLAWRRKYYPEAVMYSFVFLFSSFYHACDVTDNAIQFCITSHASLQFGDFFIALLSIWATMLAISDIDFVYRATLHVFGAIVLSYYTVIDKTGVYIFLLITIPGVIIIAVNWYLKYRKSGKAFVKRKYLKFYFSSGAVIMVIGIMIFAFLQTAGNYMYLHSLWHCIVGVTVLLILPRPDTFALLDTL